ncbi:MULTISPECIES: diadenylate cyclase CdaA [unclassified Candidatus Cardinium]|uniref:diadenylate cyclase CdaA n=1 Tax=unclassified Candidatus Cardinium TaxID=2641185 RepID=UPI001FB541C5|nr:MULTISPECIES: diadenylate cyclase CdaA [unclassified Candidatus Cardinium]
MSLNLLYLATWDTRFTLVIDMVLIGFLIFAIYKLVEGSIAVKSILGFLVVYLFYWIVRALHLNRLASILSIFTTPIVPIIIFQREIRHFLFSIGKSLLGSKAMMVQIIPWLTDQKSEVDVTPVVKAVQTLGGSNTGALIVFTKDADLRHYEESGDLINAVVSARLLIAIFNKYSPLHDGAVIIHSNKIVAARCILPVTDNPNIAARFGLRHKAAVGLTEITDALVLIVSEESGQISIAKKGSMENNLSAQEIRSALKEYIGNG